MTAANSYQEIRRALGAFVKPGGVVEIRALEVPVRGRDATVYGYFDNLDLAAREASQIVGAAGVYFIPNEIKPAALARAKNRIKVAGKDAKTTSDSEIKRRLWWLIDADVTGDDRVSGVSSTDEEHAAGLERAEAIYRWLIANGVQASSIIRGDSGNGGHLAVGVDLPPDDGGLIVRLLSATSFWFTDHLVKIDQSVKNPARAWKLYGTVAGKGDDVDDRPHRMARLLDVPDPITITPVSVLEKIAATVPQPETDQRRQATAPGDAFDLERFITDHDLSVSGPNAWEHGERWIFPTCPWNDAHTNRSAYLLRFKSGAIAAGCHHDGCAGKKWADLRELYEPKANRPSRRRETRRPDVESETEAAPDAGRQTAPVDVQPMTLSEVQAVYRKWLHVPDTGALEVTLGAYAANLQHGDPVWLLLVDVAGGGKTEAINSTSKLKHIRPVAVLTEAALLSGTSKKETAKGAKGGLLRELGEFGILTLKDFGSVLSMNRDSRGPILAALREVYDGSWTRYVGTDGGRELHWQGKAGMIAGATPAIDGHHAVMASLGERFLFYRPERGQEEENERTIRAAHSVGHEQEMREEIATAVAGLFAGLAIPEERTPLTGAETRKIVALATFVARGRAAVERDTYSHSKEIVLVPGAESPTRLVKQLAMLLSGLLAIGVAYERAWMLVVKVGMDSMPQMRHKVFHALLNCPGEMATRAVSEVTKVLTGSARRVLEELAVYDLAERNAEEKADLWCLSTWARDAYAAATAPIAAPGDAQPTGDTVPQIREAMYSAEQGAEGAQQGGSLSIIPTQPHDSTNLGNGVESAAAEEDPSGCPSEAAASHDLPLAEATASVSGTWGVI